MSSESSHQTVQILYKELKQSKLYYDMLSSAMDECDKNRVRLSELKKSVQTGLVNSGWEKKLRNVVFAQLQKVPPVRFGTFVPEECIKEPLAHLRKAQANWEKRILKSLNSMCTELGVPLARRRAEKDQREIQKQWTELSAYTPDLSQIRPVYAPKDFLEVVIALQNNNYDTGGNILSGCHHHWGIIQIPLKTPTLHDLRLQFSDISINQCQTGVDDSDDVPPEVFDNERTKLGRKVVKAEHGPVAQEYSKKGCPVSLRAELWRQMLGIHTEDIDPVYFEQLKTATIQHDLLVDSLLYKDVKLTATNDDHYFVFEDYLYQVLLPFSRDTALLDHFSRSSAQPPKSYIRGKLGMEEYAVTYPPNGIIPFHGFAMYVAPLCYLYDDPVRLYFVFRELYTRYLFRLHTISSHPQGIVSLSLLFERLLTSQETMLYFHLRSISCQPLRIAFKWLVRAYSGYLSSDQVLLLWDRILAYNSMEILAVLAVAIFSFRKSNLLKARSSAAAEAVLADLTTLQVIPLIQLMLFST